MSSVNGLRRYLLLYKSLVRIAGVGFDVVVEIPALALVEGHEQGDKFMIHVFRGTIVARHAAPRDHNGSDEPGVAQMVTADMVPDRAGVWMFHCHVSDHMAAGMMTHYEVLP